jgi:hypothetical protein
MLDERRIERWDFSMSAYSSNIRATIDEALAQGVRKSNKSFKRNRRTTLSVKNRQKFLRIAFLNEYSSKFLNKRLR